MNRVTILGVVLVVALVLGACQPATPTAAPTVSVPEDTATPLVMETETPSGTTTMEVPTATAEATLEATVTAGTTGVSIATSTSADVSEPFLVDQQGRALYVFASDTQNSGTSACTGDCLTNWPPVLVTEMPTAGTGVDTAMLGTITRDDGTMQATYNGWPLYYYSGDLAAGDMSGQGMQDSWFLVSATGNAIRQ